MYTILLILGEIWSKGSNLTSLLLIDVFAEVAQVNAEALNIKSYQPRQKHCRGNAEEKCVFRIGGLIIIILILILLLLLIIIIIYLINNN